MKNIVFLTVLFVLVQLLSSCGTIPGPSEKNPHRPMPNSQQSSVVGTVETIFLLKQVPGYAQDNRNISNMAYIELLKKAKEINGDNADVFDITWTQRRSVYGETGWLGNEFSAAGRVVVPGAVNRFAGIEDALIRAANSVTRNVPKNSVIAIVYITAQDKEIINYIADELEFILVKDGYIISNRSQLDIIRQEQNFQLSGEADDSTAINIGKILGANVIITGSLDGSDNLRRLRLRVLNAETGQVIGAVSEQL